MSTQDELQKLRNELIPLLTRVVEALERTSPPKKETIVEEAKTSIPMDSSKTATVTESKDTNETS